MFVCHSVRSITDKYFMKIIILEKRMWPEKTCKILMCIVNSMAHGHLVAAQQVFEFVRDTNNLCALS